MTTDKTKEDLIVELQGLSQENNSLRESLEKVISMRRQIDEESTILYDGLSKVNQFSIELSMLSPEEDIHAIINKHIKEFSGATMAMFSDYDPISRTLITKHMEMEPGLLQKFVGMVRGKGKTVRSEVSDEMYAYLSKKDFEVRKTLYEVSFGTIPRPLAAAIQALFKVDRFIGIAYLIEGKLYGTSLLGMPADKPDPQMHIMKNFISIASVSLRRKRAEEKIRLKDIEFRKLSAHVPDLIFQFTRRPDGTYCVPIASEGIKNIFGCSPEDVLDDFSPISSVIFPEDAERVISDIEFSAKHLTPFSCEFRVQIPAKSIQWIFSRSTPEKLPDGSITWYGFNTDITERKLAEDKMKSSEQRYRILFDQANEGLILLTMDGKIAELNQSFAQMHGYTVDEMRNMDIKDLDVLGDASFEGRELIMQGIFAGETVRFEVEHYHKDGHSFVLSDTVSLVTIAGNQYFFAFHQDITERRQAEIALKESEEKYKQIFDNTFDIMSIYEVTEDGRFKVLDFNATEAKLIGDIEYYRNKYIDDCIPPDLYNQFKQNYERCVREEKLILYEEEITFQDFTKTFFTQLIPVKNIQGRVHRIIVISSDMTETRKLQNQLISQNENLKSLNVDLTIAKEKAEESDRLKSAFLANMSHEIRTPMNGILGFSDLLSEPGLTSEDQKEYITLIQQSSNRMLNILHEIVDISRIESGLVSIHFLETNINENIENVFNFLKPEADKKSLTLSFKNGLQDKNASVVTDTDKVYLILTNLVKNAIKYTDTGFIEFGYRKKELALEFFIKDTGIGIKKERQEAIFERFVQADIEDLQARQGAGLGLSIAKAYVEMLGGKIWVNSEVGVGSTFYFTLPYNVKAEEVT
ncbi:MAG: PAS domain S-box protein [Bacteroidota bacterium]